MRLRKVITVDKPIDKVYAYLSDFTTSTEWDPNTITTVLVAGAGEIGSRYLNTSTFAGRQTELIYVTQELVPNHRIALRGENKTVVVHDIMIFQSVRGGDHAGVRTAVTYTADFAFKRSYRFIAPLLRPALSKLGTDAEAGMIEALNRL